MLFCLLFSLILNPDLKYQSGDLLKTTGVFVVDSVEMHFEKTQTRYSIPMYSQLLVVQVSDSGYYIQIGQTRHSPNLPMYFARISDLEKNVIQRHLTWFEQKGGKMSGTSFSLTQMTLPFKFYLGKEPLFTSAVNLGTSFGYQVRMSRYRPNYLSVISFIGLSSVRLDQSLAPLVGETSKDIAALTGALGMALNLNKAQISVLIGWDYLNENQTKYKWKYYAKPWLSMGLGYTLFTSDFVRN